VYVQNSVKEVDKIIRSQTIYIMKVESDLLANQTRLKMLSEKIKDKSWRFKKINEDLLEPH
jgi:hypothetical protein